MKRLFFKILVVLTLAFVAVSPNAMAQVAITEEPDLSTEYMNPIDYYNKRQEEARDYVTEQMEEAAQKQFRQFLIVGAVAVVLSVIVVLVATRKPRRHRRRW